MSAEEDHHRLRRSLLGRGRRVRRSDTNILAVNFNTLMGPSDVHTGDAVVCSNKNCAAILSHFSTLMEQEDQKEEKVRQVLGLEEVLRFTTKIAGCEL